MPDDILGGQGATLLMAIVIVAIALLALVGVFWIIRARSTSTFIRGGKNRQPRLAVLDATAVDTRRRLVLIRRDDVEHLIMIGGPSDIVIESRIVHPADDKGALAPHAAPAPKAAPQRTEPQPEPMPRPAPAAAHKPVPPARPQPQPRRPEPELARPELARPPSPPPQPSPQTSPKTSTSPPASSPAVAAATAATAATAAGSVGSIRAEAFEVLESARARVFEEPSFDEAAYEELTSAPDPAPRAATAPSPASAPSTYTPATSSYTPAPAFERAIGSPATPPPAARQPARPEPGDFESVLAAELSEDLSLDSEGGHFEPLEDDLQDVTFEIDRDQAPEVKPDSPPSRDSLEAEMERLLGDLSRKP